jgi:hypothetical protein
MRRLFTVLAALALLSMSACGGGAEKDITDREITDGELSLMVLPLSDLGSQYAQFELDEDESGFHPGRFASSMPRWLAPRAQRPKASSCSLLEGMRPI